MGAAPRRPGDTAAPGTQLFADLNNALADTPPDRIAGVVLLTDGAGARRAEVGGGARLRRAGARAADRRPDEFDRRIEVVKAPRYGIVGQSREIEVAVRETGGRRAGARDA